MWPAALPVINFFEVASSIVPSGLALLLALPRHLPAGLIDARRFATGSLLNPSASYSSWPNAGLRTADSRGGCPYVDLARRVFPAVTRSASRSAPADALALAARRADEALLRRDNS